MEYITKKEKERQGSAHGSKVNQGDEQEDKEKEREREKSPPHQLLLLSLVIANC